MHDSKCKVLVIGMEKTRFIWLTRVIMRECVRNKNRFACFTTELKLLKPNAISSVPHASNLSIMRLLINVCDQFIKIIS